MGLLARDYKCLQLPCVTDLPTTMVRARYCNATPNFKAKWGTHGRHDDRTMWGHWMSSELQGWSLEVWMGIKTQTSPLVIDQQTAFQLDFLAR